MSRTNINEIIAALKATTVIVKGVGMNACAGTIDWAIEELENLTSEEKENSLKVDSKEAES